MARSSVLAALALMFNAFVWGVSWWPLRQLESHGLHPLWSTALIYLVSLACLLAIKPSAWRPFAANPMLWLLMAASGMTNVGFNWAVTIGDVVRVVLLFYLMPAWTVLLAWPLLGIRPTAGAVGRMVLALAGVAVVLKTPGTPWPLPESAADWLALMGGLSFSLTNILLRRMSAVPGEARIMAMFSGGALMAGTAGLLGLSQGIVNAPPALQGSWLLLGLGLSLAFLVGNVALQYGAARLHAHTTSLIMLSEVIFASVSAVALGAGEFTERTWLGGALIVAAALWSAWPGRTPAAASA